MKKLHSEIIALYFYTLLEKQKLKIDQMLILTIYIFGASSLRKKYCLYYYLPYCVSSNNVNHFLRPTNNRIIIESINKDIWSWSRSIIYCILDVTTLVATFNTKIKASVFRLRTIKSPWFGSLNMSGNYNSKIV